MFEHFVLSVYRIREGQVYGPRWHTALRHDMLGVLWRSDVQAVVVHGLVKIGQIWHISSIGAHQGLFPPRCGGETLVDAESHTFGYSRV